MLTASALFPNHMAEDRAALSALSVQAKVWLRTNARIPVAMASALLPEEFITTNDLGAAHDVILGRSYVLRDRHIN